MMILFEVVRWILIVGFMALGMFMIPAAARAIDDERIFRYIGFWMIFFACAILAVVTFQVQP